MWNNTEKYLKGYLISNNVFVVSVALLIASSIIAYFDDVNVISVYVMICVMVASLISKVVFEILFQRSISFEEYKKRKR